MAVLGGGELLGGAGGGLGAGGVNRDIQNFSG